jgi:predicted ABC-type ATPase
LIATGQSFTFESVMSSAAKLDTLRQARAAGFRIYLYYVPPDRPRLRFRQRLAEVENGRELLIREEYVPDWFARAVLHKLTGLT